MTPADLAMLHRRCFKNTRPWNEGEFVNLLTSKFVFLVAVEYGFALGRTIADETELLTIAVDPKVQNNGIGMQLLDKFHKQSHENGAEILFLEVAASNRPAIRIYEKSGYYESARRLAYYQMTNGSKVDAILMQKTIGKSISAV